MEEHPLKRAIQLINSNYVPTTDYIPNLRRENVPMRYKAIRDDGIKHTIIISKEVYRLMVQLERTSI